MEKDLLELDFKKLINIVWDKRIITFISVIFFVFIGIFIGFTTPYEYTAKTTLVPVKSSSPSSSINQLASLAGFDLMGGLGSEEVISPSLYPAIVSSTPFLKEISNFKIKIKESDNRVLLKDYLFNYSQLNIFEIFSKDVLNREIKSLNKQSNISNDNSSIDSSFKYIHLTPDDELIYESIYDKIFIEFSPRDGLLSIQASMPDPISAAELTQKVTDLLQQKIIDFKIKKAKNELNFLEERHYEVEKLYNERRNSLAEFEDKNMNLISSKSTIRLNQLQSDFELTSNVFLQLSQQLESQKLKVKKETPVFSIIEPVNVPLIRSKPVRGNILKISTVFGFILGVSISLIIHFYKIYFNKI